MSTPFRDTSVTSTETVARMNDLTDPISRASSTMASCSAIFVTGELEKTGTDA